VLIEERGCYILLKFTLAYGGANGSSPLHLIIKRILFHFFGTIGPTLEINFSKVLLVGPHVEGLFVYCVTRMERGFLCDVRL